jgi:hypothetical protein
MQLADPPLAFLKSESPAAAAQSGPPLRPGQGFKSTASPTTEDVYVFDPGGYNSSDGSEQKTTFHYLCPGTWRPWKISFGRKTDGHRIAIESELWLIALLYSGY